MRESRGFRFRSESQCHLWNSHVFSPRKIIELHMTGGPEIQQPNAGHLNPFAENYIHIYRDSKHNISRESRNLEKRELWRCYRMYITSLCYNNNYWTSNYSSVHSPWTDRSIWPCHGGCQHARNGMLWVHQLHSTHQRHTYYL